jgi:hypothetical protein
MALPSQRTSRDLCTNASWHPTSLGKRWAALAYVLAALGTRYVILHAFFLSTCFIDNAGRREASQCIVRRE